jgi:hypothetical protein
MEDYQVGSVGGKEKKGYSGLKYTAHNTNEDSIVKPTKQCLKKGNEGEWKYNGRGSMFKVNYTCKELSQ